MNPPASIKDLAWSIIDALPVEFYVKDEKSRFIYANQATAKALGVARPEELLGKSDREFLGKRLADPLRREEERVLGEGLPVIDKLERAFLAGASDRDVTVTS